MQVHGDVLRRLGHAGGFAGVGTDLTAFRGGRDGPYLVAGLSGGLGSDDSDAYSAAWGSWSAGLGYDLFPASFISLGAEGRWRELSMGGRSGLELGIGLALHLGRGSRRPEPLPGPLPAAGRPVVSAPIQGSSSAGPPLPATVADSIVATAADAMGRPYEFGGTGVDGEGFDCSGLIQHSYARHGIELPRRSVDQAKAGRKIARRLEDLSPADILTFSNRGGQVTHVGLYMGDGRFIHSATRGVQVSTLSPEDPYGRWWYKRWVGVRRVVP